MPSSKKSGKTKGAKKRKSNKPHELRSETLWSSASYHAVVVAIGSVAIALGWGFIMRGTNHSDAVLSPKDLLEKIKRNVSFELAGDSNRTLVATADIPADMVLVEIPRELMIWDLDAARDEFVRKELFNTPMLKGTSSDPMSKRAALLSAYLALLRNNAVAASSLQLSVARAMPSYEEYSSFHPVLANLTQMREYLGEHSLAYQLLVRVRETLVKEHVLLSVSSKKFSNIVSREEYLASRIAVQSRAFEIPNLPESEVSQKEGDFYKQKIGIDFSVGVVSIEPVNDWMNSHVNNNVKVGGYDAKKRAGLAWATKTIHKGQELINSYGEFYDFVLFSQYGYVPSDGSGTSIATLFVHHETNLMGGFMDSSIAATSLPPLEKMAPYLQYDYGYAECISEETQPRAFELKRLKLEYLQRIALDRACWILPLPPRASTDTTPMSTTTLSDDYKVPSFDHDEVHAYLEEKALSVSLPCRLITLTDSDMEDGVALLKEDLDRLKQSSANMETPILKLEELQVNLPWMARTIHCMRKLASDQMHKYGSSVEDQKQHIMNLAESGNTNTLEWNAAHVKLEEMQSQVALENWASDALHSVSHMEHMSKEELFVRDEPCLELENQEDIENVAI